MLKESAASMFKTEEGSSFTLVMRGCRFHQNVVNYLPDYTVLIPKDCSFKCLFSVNDYAGFHAEMVIFVL
jgi:hypothetical protein